MSVASVEKKGDERLTIHIKDRFDFNDYRPFRQAYENVDASLEFVVNLSSTEFIDSSALSMLLLLREHAGGDSARIRVINCNPDIMRILDASNFQKLFDYS